MEVGNGWEFLTSTRPMGPLGLPILVGDTEVPPITRTGEFNLGGGSGSVSVPWNFPVRVFPIYCCSISETRAPLCAAFVTIAFESIIWRACQVPLTAVTPSAIGGLIGGMVTGMVRLINNFCGEFPLVVSLSVTFIFFPLLVLVATNSQFLDRFLRHLCLNYNMQSCWLLNESSILLGFMLECPN